MTDGQQALDGMERTTKFKFTGVKYESLKGDFTIGEEVEFRVRGHVKMTGDEDMSTGLVHLVKVEVESVAPVSFDEPADPSVQVLGQGTLDDEAAE
jgi:hypothetical protein